MSPFRHYNKYREANPEFLSLDRNVEIINCFPEEEAKRKKWDMIFQRPAGYGQRWNQNSGLSSHLQNS